MSDLIRREDAIEAVWKPQVKPNELIFDALKTAIESEINNVPSADTPQGEVDAVEIYEKAESQLERNEITVGEFEKIIEPLRHLFYNRPQGEWIETSDGTMCGNCHKFPYDDGEYHIANWYSDFCPHCGVRMKGADDE